MFDFPKILSPALVIFKNIYRNVLIKTQNKTQTHTNDDVAKSIN